MQEETSGCVNLWTRNNGSLYYYTTLFVGFEKNIHVTLHFPGNSIILTT